MMMMMMMMMIIIIIYYLMLGATANGSRTLIQFRPGMGGCL